MLTEIKWCWKSLVLSNIYIAYSADKIKGPRPGLWAKACNLRSADPYKAIGTW